MLIIIFNTLLSFSQAKKDTLYIEYDSSYAEMRNPSSFFTHPKLTSPDSLSVGYSIESYSSQLEHNVVNMLTHYVMADFVKERAIEGEKYSYPAKKEVDLSFIKNKRILDIHYFRKVTFEEVENLFRGQDFQSSKDDPFIWIYDVNEINNGKVLLREVWYIYHQDE